jgi:anaerobic magnesium-protoporphyrin IX monomethyl ester cyclase
MSPDIKFGDKLGVLITARGCPFDCIFCSNRLLTKGKYRTHSIDRVCAEISELIEKYEVNQVLIIDDNYSVDKKRAKQLCEEFIRRGFHKKVSFMTEARVDCVDAELLHLMARANFKIISYGLESGNQRLLDLIKKNITLEQTKKAIELTKEAGIAIRASFILGLPTETREESLRTIKFAKDLGIDQVRFALATPFPGTKLWDIAHEEGPFHVTDWRQFSMMSGYTKAMPVYSPAGRNPQELAKLQRYANLTFFLRPRVVLGYLGRMTSVNAFRDITYGALNFIRASLFPSK